MVSEQRSTDRTPVRAYMLINTDGTSIRQILDHLRASAHIDSAHMVAGPYDIIATIQAESIDELGDLVTEEMQQIVGVERTLSCIVLR